MNQPDPKDAIIVVENLHRRFGNIHAVRGLSFSIGRGEVVGFIGANGAGKTTTMRIITSLESPTAGRVRVCGHDVVADPNAVRRHVGWMPDDMEAYPGMIVWEYLDFFARAFGLNGDERRARVAEVMAFTDLDVLAERPCKGLSKGQTQRLCLARTLLHDPEVLILDEPAAGLDPKARMEFKNLVRLLKDKGKTIFISSHILSELAEMCTSLLFIDQGRLVHHGDADSVKFGRDGDRIVMRVRAAGDTMRLYAVLESLPATTVTERLRDGALFTVPKPADEAAELADLLAALTGAGVRVFEFHRVEQRLEDAFVAMLKENATPPPLPAGRRDTAYP